MEFYSNQINVIELERQDAFDIGWKSFLVIVIVLWYLFKQANPVYLLDFATFEPPEEWKLTSEELMTIMKAQGCFTEDSLAFLERMLSQSGCGPSTAWPPGTVQCLRGLPADTSAEAARLESEV